MSTDTMSLSAEPPRDHVDAVARLADACAAAARTALAGLPAWLRFHDDLDVEWDVPEHEVNAAFIEERRLALPNRAAPLPADEKAEVAAVAKKWSGYIGGEDADLADSMIREALNLTARGFMVTAAHRPVCGNEYADCTCGLYAAKQHRQARSCAIGKHPVGSKWQERVSLDLEKTAERFVYAIYTNKKTDKDKPKVRIEHACNISLVTGPESGVIALDPDGAEGMRNLAKLQSIYGMLPQTIASVSGSGKGMHLLFRCPPDLMLRNTAKALGFEGSNVDVRGHHGQIIVAPSLHHSGGSYAWADGCSPDSLTLADLPEAWVQLILDASKKTEKGERKAREVRMAQRSSMPQAATSWGLDAILDSMGDGEGHDGFHKPINRAALSYFGTGGVDADPQILKDLLLDAIERAPKRDGRDSDLLRYTSDDYLDESIRGAMEYIADDLAAKEAELEVVRNCIADLKEGDTKAAFEAAKKLGGVEVDPLEAANLTEAIAKKAGSKISAVNAEVKKARAKSSRKEESGGETVSEGGYRWPAGIVLEDGWLHASAENKNGEPYTIPLCGVFTPMGRKRNAKDAAYGVVIRFKPPGGIEKEVAYDVRTLTGEKHVVIAELANVGLPIKQHGQSMLHLHTLLGDVANDTTLPDILEAFQPGFDFEREVFVCPTGEIIGTAKSGETIRLADGGRVKDVKPAGEEAGSRDALNACFELPEHFHYGLLALEGLAGTVLQAAGMKSGGITVCGDPGLGKSTGQGVQVSHWATPKPGRGLLFSMDNTSFAIEDRCRVATGTTLALDEVKQIADVNELARLPFKITGETTRGRGDYRQNGSVDGYGWNVSATLSTEKRYGETLKAKGITAVAGAVRRFPEVALTQDLKINPGTDARAVLDRIMEHEHHYGHIGPLFVRKFMEEGWHLPDKRRALAKAIGDIVADLVKDGHEEKANAAEKFAVLVWVGRALTRYGILEEKHKPDAVVRMAWENFANSNEARALKGATTSMERFISAVCIGMRTGTICEAGLLPDNWKDLNGLVDRDKKVVSIFAERFALMVGGEHGTDSILNQMAKEGLVERPSERGRYTHGRLAGLRKGTEAKVAHYRFPLSAFEETIVPQTKAEKAELAMEQAAEDVQKAHGRTRS